MVNYRRIRHKIKIKIQSHDLLIYIFKCVHKDLNVLLWEGSDFLCSIRMSVRLNGLLNNTKVCAYYVWWDWPQHHKKIIFFLLNFFAKCAWRRRRQGFTKIIMSFKNYFYDISMSLNSYNYIFADTFLLQKGISKK